jgi:hypothetical protein
MNKTRNNWKALTKQKDPTPNSSLPRQEVKRGFPLTTGNSTRITTPKELQPDLKAVTTSNFIFDGLKDQTDVG